MIKTVDVLEVRFVLPHTNIDTIAYVESHDKENGVVVVSVNGFQNLNGYTALISGIEHDVKYLGENETRGVSSQQYRYELKKRVN